MQHNASVPRILLTVPEVADALKCGRSIVYKLMGRGQLSYVKLGSLTRIPVDSVTEYIDREARANSADPRRPLNLRANLP